MKFLRNILIIGVVTIILFSISIHFAERSSGNTVYIFIIAGCAVALVSRVLINLSYWKSLKKDLDATPQELLNKSVKMEKYYVGEIVMFIAGAIFFSYGYKEYAISGFDKNSIVYFLGSLICFILIIKGLISKKTRIEKIANTTIPEQNNMKRDNRVMVFVVIGLIVLSFLYKFFN
jgi:hypothetical protein